MGAPGVALHVRQRAARLLDRLARVQQRLLLALDFGAGGALARLQLVQRAGAGNHLGVLLGALGGAAGGDPVGEALALGADIGLRHLQLQARLLERVGAVLRLALAGLDGVARGLRRRAVHEVVQRQPVLDPWQIAHHGAAQANQETGEHQGHQPQAALKPLLRQAQGFAHGDSGSNGALAPTGQAPTAM
ncbi:hypothetical protein MASR1M50_20990 [Burkholderiales bacterium]